jgi:hypothetical protein
MRLPKFGRNDNTSRNTDENANDVTREKNVEVANADNDSDKRVVLAKRTPMQRAGIIAQQIFAAVRVLRTGEFLWKLIKDHHEHVIAVIRDWVN